MAQFGQTRPQNGNGVRTSAEPTSPAASAAGVKKIPYDYVARFQLEGRRCNRVQQVINISVEGTFVAVEIGYSFIPARMPDQGILSPPSSPIVFLASLAPILDEARQNQLAQCLMARFCGIDFKYSFIDSGTGRELQDQPIHNIAGLGEANGIRPFRPLATPQYFLPRSTIRIEIEEISQGVTDEEQRNSGQQLYSIYGYTDIRSQARIGSELYIVFHGYKMLGYETGMT